MRKQNTGEGEFIHVYNRGVLKSPIFFNERDKKRLLFLILYFQSAEPIKNLDRSFKKFARDPIGYAEEGNNSNEERIVELTAFAFMPNHFHLLLHELKESGIAKYMHRVETAYAKYINVKYQRSGHLFQGPYKAVRMESNEQLLHLSAYIHKNPADWRKSFYSSYQDYTANRWGELLRTKIITEQFSGRKDDTYKNFVETSTAKELENKAF